ncbi:MAG: glycogen-binding domain-containing protein [Syntrophobacteraceae bacterium]
MKFRLFPLVFILAVAALSGCALDGMRAGQSDLMPVTFVHNDIRARKVCIAGDFNGWLCDSNYMTAKDGVWSTTLVLAPGRYRYHFMVDGKKVLDPGAASESDGFGGGNAVLVVE